MADLVHDFAYVTQADLEGLISNAAGMIVPTLFEAASFPVWESFRLGTPVACSTVTSLPRQVGSAAVTFDPLSVSQMTEAIKVLWGDEHRNQLLVEAGYRQLSELSWARTARQFLALYKLIGKWPLTDEDSFLLAKAPVL